PKPLDYLGGLIQPPNSLPGCIERYAVSVMFHLEPARSEPHDESPVTRMVQGLAHTRKDRRIPVGVTCDKHPHSYPRCFGSQAGKRYPALETWARRVAQNRKEMIECPGSVIADLVYQAPYGFQVLPGSVVRCCLDTKAYRFLH